MDKYSLNMKLECGEENNKRLLEISSDSEYKLLEVEGLESSDYDVNISSNSQYDGGILDSKKISSRSITFSAEYTGRDNISKERDGLISFFNPKKTGVLIVDCGSGARKISYEVESFKIKQSNINDPLGFLVTLICPDPYFEDINDLQEIIAVWSGGLEFDFSLPLSFKTRNSGESGGVSKEVIVGGHVETPLEIEFEGPAEQPKVTNVTTGEFITVNQTLKENEILYINTAYGNKKVKIITNKGEKNAFNYIDLNSTFFSLIPGKNTIEYTNSNATLTEQNVCIKYKNKYLGI
ncbi:phage tail family protein [Clostridium sp. SHJSY1]|uniref:phage distal tail protein n=1 Tax=Clostridium sp. SHJSY1 TaxID=2942483 RepID=UPI0028744305|nr:phage tail domain-containing protein [Clostridium sp. SHJSY1]MDS0525003.1 phage tail family protein [Clostridium sp. SHJSY1]